MKKLSFLAVILALALLLCSCGVEYVNQFADIPKPEAVFTLDVDGAIYYLRFTLDPAAAPNTVCNFISLANGGYYDGLKIDYVYPTYFMRGGDPDGDGTGGPGYTIAGEFRDNGFPIPGISHSRGVISMCRLPEDNNSAGSQFFVMFSRQSAYDGQYAAFGQLKAGDSESAATLSMLENALTDRSSRPVVRQTIVSVRVDTKGYVYEVTPYEPEPEPSQQ